ncbi:hypothetical protein FQZ97_961950 [compost metagenome]
MGDDGFLDIGLPDTHHAGAVLRNARRIDQAGVDGEGAGGGGQVAAVAAPVDEGLVDGDLAVEVVDVVLGLAALRQDHALAGAGGGAAHAVDVRRIRIGAADHAHEQLVAGFTRNLAALGQVLQAEEHALAGAAADVGGGDLHLGYVGHGIRSWQFNVGASLLANSPAAGTGSRASSLLRKDAEPGGSALDVMPLRLSGSPWRSAAARHRRCTR